MQHSIIVVYLVSLAIQIFIFLISNFLEVTFLLNVIPETYTNQVSLYWNEPLNTFCSNINDTISTSSHVKRKKGASLTPESSGKICCQ